MRNSLLGMMLGLPLILAGCGEGTWLGETAPPPVQRNVGDTAPSGRKYDDPNYRSGGSIGGS